MYRWWKRQQNFWVTTTLNKCTNKHLQNHQNKTRILKSVDNMLERYITNSLLLLYNMHQNRLHLLTLYQDFLVSKLLIHTLPIVTYVSVFQMIIPTFMVLVSVLICLNKRCNLVAHILLRYILWKCLQI